MSSALLPEDQWPDLSGLVTEDDEPLDNVYSEKQQRLLTYPLYECWSGPLDLEGLKRPFLVMANVGLFFAVGSPPLVPDVLLSMDVEALADPFPKAGRSYFTWVYGKAPNVVVEIISNREGNELSDKLRKYERIGVPHYVVFDPELLLTDQALHSFSMANGAYVARESLTFEALGLQLVLWDGVFERMSGRWLRWATLDGTLIPTAGEQKARAEQEKQRADMLAERLRALGVDPETLK